MEKLYFGFAEKKISVLKNKWKMLFQQRFLFNQTNINHN
jgi:ABC-type transporter Mla maintaining outer membrane lipid asymmetry ATPase subunit MlaF